MSMESPRSILFMMQRLRPFGFLLSIIGVVLYFLRYDLERYFNIDSRNIFIFAAGFALYGTAILLFNYLKGERSKIYESDLMREEFHNLRNELANTRLRSAELENVKNELASLQEIVQKKTPSSDVLTDADKEELKRTVRQSLASDLSNTVLKEIEEKYSPEFKAERQLKQLREQLDRSRNRLRQEIDTLGRRGNVNLVIGVLTTVVAVAILSSTVLSQDAKFTPETLVSHFAPRFTLSIFIEIFSFFFLKLYKSGLGEIKYFQNELTNVEAKFVALENALIAGNADCINLVLSDFSKTERNFILGKDQSTVEIEKMKVDGDNSKNIIAMLSDFLKMTKK